jgi:hypothetical protein
LSFRFTFTGDTGCCFAAGFAGLDAVEGFFFFCEDRVVVLTQITVAGEQADAADVLTYRDGKLVKFQTAGDTALLERVFGSK